MRHVDDALRLVPYRREDRARVGRSELDAVVAVGFVDGEGEWAGCCGDLFGSGGVGEGGRGRGTVLFVWEELELWSAFLDAL